jgi:hypothetical protein
VTQRRRQLLPSAMGGRLAYMARALMQLDRKEWLLAIESFTQYTISRAASMERLSAAAAQLKLKLQALSSGLVCTARCSLCRQPAPPPPSRRTTLGARPMVRVSAQCVRACACAQAAATAAAAAAPAGVQGVFPPKPASIAGNEECADRPIYTRPSPRTQP